IYAQGFEKVSLSDSSFDLAIGNVPFGNYKLFDSRYAHLNLSVYHNIHIFVVRSKIMRKLAKA
ncbi:MAG: hypothetical protein ACK5QX_07635, partial [bacterium]